MDYTKLIPPEPNKLSPVYGAAMIPLEDGGFATVTWPLAVFAYREGELHIDFRWAFLKRVVKGLSGTSDDRIEIGRSTDWWACAPADLSSVQVTRRRIVFKGRRGEARFSAMSHEALVPILTLLRDLQVETTEVSSTIPWMFGGHSKN